MSKKVVMRLSIGVGGLTCSVQASEDVAEVKEDWFVVLCDSDSKIRCLKGESGIVGSWRRVGLRTTLDLFFNGHY